MIFNQRDSGIAKGFAIVMMMAHHAFAFPDRIPASLRHIPTLPGIDGEAMLGTLGKICVCLFIFISGYGLHRSSLRYKIHPLSRISAFCKVYLFYFIVTVSIGILFFPNVTMSDGTPRYTTDITTLLLNTFNIITTYNEEWWFVRVYCVMVLLFPLVRKYLDQPAILIAGSLLTYASLQLLPTTQFTNYFKQISYYQVPFVTGMLFSSMKLYERVTYRCIESPLLWGALLVTLLLTFRLVVYERYLHPLYFFVTTPLFVIGASRALRISELLTRLFEILGKYSFPMWLVHSYFCYYFLQPLTYAPRYGIAILLNLSLLTFATCFVLEKIRMALPEPLR